MPTYLIKSPLRYPGGKSRAIDEIMKYIPPHFSEYREPFLGGGSMFIYLRQKFPNLKFWVNDIHPELYCFWQQAQNNLEELITGIEKIKHTCEDGQALFTELVNQDSEQLTAQERAIRFFILNRITFSGTVESGGYSKQAFAKRFTDSSIKRLRDLGAIFKGVKMTNLDYSELLKAEGEKVFIFLDPPYLSATKSRLYGKRGHLHTGFDHDQFAEVLKGCPHQWLITYDDCLEIRKNFEFAYIYEWQLQYGMNNYKQGKAAKGKELMITNYPVEKIEKDYQQLSLPF